MKKIYLIGSLFGLLAGLVVAGSARSEEKGLVRIQDPVPWVSHLEGEENALLIKQPDTEWFEATVNTPIGEGDMLWQGPGGKSEVFIDKSTYLRLDENTGVVFDKLKKDEMRAVVTKGTVEVSNGTDRPLLVDMPGQTAIFEKGDMARIDVSEDGASQISGMKGEIGVEGPAGKFRVGNGDRLTTDADGESPRLARMKEYDQFDAWTENRDNDLTAGAAPPPTEEASYMPEPVAADLAENGTWINDPEYGWVWSPSDVAPDWAPYRAGRWTYRPVWGWTWVSYEPWGWYPYHYGRWVMSRHHHWVWSPVYVRVGWHPAVVFWVEGPDYIAWQPWPYSVGWNVVVGPSYIYYDYITVVSYTHFHSCNYYRYNRPWAGHCGSGCNVHYSPRHFSHHTVHFDSSRTPRERGYVSPSRRPSDRHYYAYNDRGAASHRGSDSRVHYGDVNRSPNRMESSRPDRRPPSSATNNRNPGSHDGPANTRSPGRSERPATGTTHDLRDPKRDYGVPTDRTTDRGFRSSPRPPSSDAPATDRGDDKRIPAPVTNNRKTIPRTDPGDTSRTNPTREYRSTPRTETPRNETPSAKTPRTETPTDRSATPPSSSTRSKRSAPPSTYTPPRTSAPPSTSTPPRTHNPPSASPSPSPSPSPRTERSHTPPASSSPPPSYSPPPRSESPPSHHSPPSSSDRGSSSHSSSPSRESSSPPSSSRGGGGRGSSRSPR